MIHYFSGQSVNSSIHRFCILRGIQLMTHTPGITPDEPTGSVYTRWEGSGKDAVQVLGTKLDAQKPRWSLLPQGSLFQVILVLEHGARKYSVDNWQHVPDARKRYYDAIHRHLEAWWEGEKTDPESGLSHLAHAATCFLFLIWFDLNV